MSPEKYFTQAQKDAMVAAIQEAEKCTSGEIRIHFQNHCQTNPLDNAVEVFEKLKMHETAQRNGVLIFIALKDKKNGHPRRCGHQCQSKWKFLG